MEAQDANEGSRGGKRPAQICLCWTAHSTCYRGWSCTALPVVCGCAEPCGAASVVAQPIAGRLAFAHRHADEHAHHDTAVYQHLHLDARPERNPHRNFYTHANEHTYSSPYGKLLLLGLSHGFVNDLQPPGFI